MNKIIEDIVAERKAQDLQWGGPEHDDKHDAIDWADFIGTQLEKVARNVIGRGEDYLATPDYRQRLVKIAALAIAGLESMDRKAAAKA